MLQFKSVESKLFINSLERLHFFSGQLKVKDLEKKDTYYIKTCYFESLFKKLLERFVRF